MKRIRKLVIEIIKYIEQTVKISSEKKVLQRLKSIPLGHQNFVRQETRMIPKEVALEKAVSTIVDRSLQNIKGCIINAYYEMQWNIDSGLFYDNNSGVGNQYLTGNMHTELIGPKNGSFKSNELRLGLFLLEPNIFYKDHKHEAPELYLNLTNGTQWRFEEMSWQEKKSGSIVYNEPFRVHAIQTKQNPFLSVWCWSTNPTTKCVVVPRNL